MSEVTPEIRQKFSVARWSIAKDGNIKGYLPLLYSLQVQWSCPVETMAVTPDWRLLIHPPFVEKTGLNDLVTAMVHEVLHVMLKHVYRPPIGRDPKLWAIAQDLSVNSIISEMIKRTVPDDWFEPTRFGFSPLLTVDQYYELLSNKFGRAGGSGVDDGGDGGDDSESESGSGPGKLGNEGLGRGRCTCPSEAHAPDPTFMVIPQGARDAKTQAAMEQFVRAAKQAGYEGAGIVGAVEEALKPPVVPWQQVFERQIRRGVTMARGARDTSYAYPSRLQAGLGYGVGRPMLPAYVKPEIQVHVVLDTSGSMGSKELLAGASEIDGIVKTVGLPVRYWCMDAESYDMGKLTSANGLKIKGGGGTDFAPVLRALKLARARSVVVITDGYGPMPSEPPPFDLIWCVTPGGAKEYPYGVVVRMEDQPA